MDPEPRTDAPALGARRHLLRDSKVREPVPHTRMVHTEHRKVPGLHLGDVALVRDRERTALEVVRALRVVLRRGRARAGVVALLDVAPARGREERCGGLGARELGRDFPARRERHECVGRWREGEVVVLQKRWK